MNLRMHLASFCQILLILSKFTPQMVELLLKNYFDKEANSLKNLLFLLQRKTLVIWKDKLRTQTAHVKAFRIKILFTVHSAKLLCACQSCI